MRIESAGRFGSPRYAPGDIAPIRRSRPWRNWINPITAAGPTSSPAPKPRRSPGTSTPTPLPLPSLSPGARRLRPIRLVPRCALSDLRQHDDQRARGRSSENHQCGRPGIGIPELAPVVAGPAARRAVTPRGHRFATRETRVSGIREAREPSSVADRMKSRSLLGTSSGHDGSCDRMPP